MVEPDASDGCDPRLADVSSVDPSAEATFQYGDINFKVSELKERNHGYDLEESCFQIVLLNAFEDLITVVNYLLLGDHFVVYSDAFSEGAHVGGDKHACLVIQSLERCCCFDCG